MDEKWAERLKILVKLMDAVEHGEAHIVWQDGHIVKIEKIQTEATIVKNNEKN